VTEALAGADLALRRMAAAQALAVFDDPAAVRALTAALDDADGLVRHHAARGLLELHGLPTPCDDYRHMIYRVMADEPETREAAKRDVLATIEGRAIGAQ
jgi:HEAT repeat protein